MHKNALRRAACCLHAKCVTPDASAAARVVLRERWHRVCSRPHPFYSRQSTHLSLRSAACFSSAAPHVKEVEELVGDNNIIDTVDNDHAHHIIDAAAHAEFKQLKDERREIHAERAKLAAEKKELNRRTTLAEELMRIFAANNECFNLTLRELNINKTWGSDSGLSEYRQFYLDSLQPFGTMLARDHHDESILSQVGLCSDSATRILEQFAEGCDGENVEALISKHNKMSRLKLREEELKSSIEKVRRNRGQWLRQLEVEEPLLKLMISEQSRVVDKHIASLDEKVSLAKDVLPSFNSAGGGDNDNYAEELEVLEKELLNALSQVSQLSPGSETASKDISRQRNKVEHAKEAAANQAKRIEVLESEIAGLKWPMTHEEFESFTENIMLNIAPSVAPALAKFIVNRHDDFARYRQLEMHTDMTSPHDWYPRARLDKRKIICHAGPTNSGKTYSALQRLKQAKKGMYLAPLRLLASEIYDSLTAEGIYSDLLTGQEQRNVPFSTHRSSTVELADLHEDYDVVVIDEIQMLADEHRGFAWTRALLGVRCKEVHVCGGAEAIDIVKKMCKMCGDDFELHQYKRFSNLKVLPQSLAKAPTSNGSYSRVQPGDCVVAFSRLDIFAIVREIERCTNYKCCVIYGTLPPYVRAEQARRFNDQNSGYDILVASDAIGMGLNLSIKRIIFNSMFKNNGERTVQLDHSSVKQIAGRAGRRNSPYPHGEVTCRDPNDMHHLVKCMGTEIRPIKKAGLIPTENHIALFNQHLMEYGSPGKEIQLHQTLRKFSEMATLKGDFFLCRQRSLEVVSHWLKDIDNMCVEDKYRVLMCPINESCPKSKKTLMRYLEKYSSGKVPGVHREMRPRPVKSFDSLADLCGVHSQLELFLWLQNKLPSNAVEVLRANTLRERTIELINMGLLNAEKLSLRHDYVQKDVRVKKKWADERRDDDSG